MPRTYDHTSSQERERTIEKTIFFVAGFLTAMLVAHLRGLNARPWQGSR